MDNFKWTILKDYTQLRIVGMWMKVDQFTAIETSCCLYKFLQNEIENLASCTSDVASEMLTWVGGGGWNGGERLEYKMKVGTIKA